jgi:hypothetical protein
MFNRRGTPRYVSPADCVRVVVLFVAAVGCATTDAARVAIDPPARSTAVFGSDRVLVAGFIAGFVADRRGNVDVNTETARFVRMELRSKTSLPVVESEPLRLEALSAQMVAKSQYPPTTAPVVGASAMTTENPLFRDVTFWRRIGEEYGEPLIVTGAMDFKFAGLRYEERQVGRRTIRLWRRGFSLSGSVLLINGRTGELMDSVTLRRSSRYATNAGESALTLYFQLMDQAMPTILTLLRQKGARERVLLR